MPYAKAMTCSVALTTCVAAIAFGTNTERTNGTRSNDGLRIVSQANVPTEFGAEQSQYALTLGDRKFDPLVNLPAPPVGWGESEPDEGGNDLGLVQFTGPIDQRWLDDLEAAGVKPIQYVHPYTYITWSGGEERAAMQNIPAVRRSGAFTPEYRVLPRYRNLDDAVIDVRFMLYRGADVDATMTELEQIAGRPVGRRAIDETFDVAVFRMPGNLIQQAAQIAGVYSVQPVPTDGGLRGEMTNQLNVGNYDGTNAAFPGYLTYLNSIGLDGSGVVIANVDGGVQESHPDLVNNILPCVGTTCSTGSSSHGTHTAGIMAADGASGTTDSFGFFKAQGVAPGASLVVQQYSPYFTQPGGMLLLMTDSYNNGASLSGNSWGPAGSPQGYDSDTRQVDVGVRDADPNAAGNQPLTFVLSFMNGGGGTSTQGSPDEAKNLFNIGSTKAQTGSGAQILDIDDLSSNTAHGPALDGRTIPHMVAPGCEVDSASTGSGYDLKCGTSMASPHVSGAVALFIEYYRNLPSYVADPSPALVKAAFLPVAFDLAGRDDADGGTLGHPFDNKQGWGRMNLDAVVNPPANSVRYIDAPVTFDNSGEEWTIQLSPLDPNQPMKIMLVWTDAPGHGLGGSTPAWNNDLDLIVDAGVQYRGNNFGGDGFSVSGGTADGMNNTEGVFLGPIPPGAVTVTVRATNINSDGVPNFGDGTDQDFALVAYNAAEEPGFFLSADATNAEVCTPTQATYDVEIGQILGYTESVTLSTENLPAGATASFSANPITPPATVTLTLDNTGSVAPGLYNFQIVGDTVDLNRSSTVSLAVSDAPPAAPGIVSPGDGANGVGLAPMLTWSGSAQAAEYQVDIATDNGFGNVIYSGTETELTHVPSIVLDSVTTYFWRVRGSNVCGDGAYESASFTTLDAPPILLVDDDDNSPDVRDFYTDTLDAMGFGYDVFDTNNTDNEPDAAKLSQYELVIWFTGDEFGGAAGPGSIGEQALGAYLDNGRCLFLSSQDYYYDRGLTSFMTDYLGVSTATSDVSQSTVNGLGVFGSMGIYSLSYPFTNWSDIISPSASGAAAFDGNAGNAAVTKDGGAYRTVFLGFPMEAISNTTDRANILLTAVEWCDELFETPCASDIAGDPALGGSGAPDGTVDTFDLLKLLEDWGACDLPCPPSCDADITGDCAVDTFDLLELLENWNGCD